jgi:uncharacterized protein YceK
MKRTAILLCLAFSLGLSGCGSAVSTATAESQNQNAVVSQGINTVRLNTDYDNAATVEIQLLAGTLKLEGTDQAVTASQAAVLLPLWQQVQTLSRSLMPAMGGPRQQRAQSTPTAQIDAAAMQSQIDGVLEQIQSDMTPGQIQAIAAMQITQESAATVAQGLGQMGGPGGQSGGNPPGQRGTPHTGDGQAAGGGGPSAAGTEQASGAGGQQPAWTPPAGGSYGQDGGLEMMLLSAVVRTMQNRAGMATEQTGTGGGAN